MLIISFLATFGTLSVLAAEATCCANPIDVKTSSVVAFSYPLTTCVVSGEALEGGNMGGPVDYIHKAEGKLGRLVRFCCSGCVKNFKKDPAKYLAKLDAAAATIANTGTAAPADKNTPVGHAH
ncbi:hypothetical protein IMCC26134_10255 [Verrucomicrobia bacterium IMCC26134]|nr:hypothetical protein IMCC26134_10255 [Verrucomicrobia bacterium IMCC26134]